MGTTKEWAEVLFNAILFGCGTPLLFRRMEGKIPKLMILIYALGALLFGLIATFDDPIARFLIRARQNLNLKASCEPSCQKQKT